MKKERKKVGERYFERWDLSAQVLCKLAKLSKMG
jgi:hypothetical protein